MKKWLVVNYDGTKAIIEWDSVIRFNPDQYRYIYKDRMPYPWALSYNEYSSKDPLWMAAVTEEECRERNIMINRLDFPEESDIDYKLTGRHMTWEDEPVEIE